MKTARHALIALAVLAALSLSGCTVPTDPTFVGHAENARQADAPPAVHAQRAQS